MMTPLETYELSKVILASILAIVCVYIALFWPFGDNYLGFAVIARLVSGIIAVTILVWVGFTFDEFIHDKYGRK